MSSPFDPADFRAALHRAADLVADYVETVGERPVVPEVVPGSVADALPEAAPEIGEDFDALLDDYRRLIEPNVTHWNHPGFLAYFSSSGSEPGILGEMLAAGLSVNGMLWHTAPAAVELEVTVCDWLRQLLGLPDAFSGHINDTASISTFLALAIARERPELDVRRHGLANGAPPMVVYASSETHSSIDKAAIGLGLGSESIHRVAVDDALRMDPAALERAIAADRAAGRLPIAVVATLGTTSTTSVDPVDAIASVCQREDLWLHVDAAWAGSAAVCPEERVAFAGWERADSIVVNPHKWLFTPMDCSVLFVREPDRLRAAFSLVPEYLVTPGVRGAEHPAKIDLMDFGVQLGRRFRALKLWFVMRAFGVSGLRERLREHLRLGRELAARIDADPHFERLAPAPFSVVCFRALLPEDPSGTAAESKDAALDAFNARLLDEILAEGSVFMSHTRVDGRYALRIAVSNLRTEAHHVDAAWELCRQAASRLRQSSP